MKSIGVIVLSVVVGIGVGAILFFQPATVVVPPSTDTISNTTSSTAAVFSNEDASLRLNELERQIQQEKAAREALTLEVTRLKQALLTPNPTTVQTNPVSSRAESSLTNNVSEPPRVETPSLGEETVRTMVALGVPQETAERLRRRNDQLNLARLQLQDRATREGWINTSRFRDENKALDNQEAQLRHETGEEAYDRFLYATGQDNRVRIEDVMLDSPALTAGLQSGDVILSYNKKRVFSWPELREAIAEGQLGEQVIVTIQRGDELRETYLPRGPMGVRIETVRLSPEVARR